jgi:ATP-dependent phosphoenolpyruvate carboxykinase
MKTKDIMLVNDPTSKATIAWGHNTKHVSKENQMDGFSNSHEQILKQR